METRFGKIKTKRLRASRPVALILGGILFAAVLLMAIAPSLFTSCDPYEQDLMNMLQPPSAVHISAPITTGAICSPAWCTARGSIW